MVRLLGQIGLKKKRVTFSDEIDEIIQILNDDELEKHVTNVNFTLSDVDDQIREMEGEIKQSKFNTTLKLSSDKSYSNSDIDSSNLRIDDTNDMDDYDVSPNGDENRRIEILSNLSLTLGNLFISY